VRTIPYFTPIPSSFPPHPDGARAILFSSRIVREKGLHVLLRALATVDGSWRLCVAGEGADRRQAEESARRIGVADRVSFLGWLDHEALTARLAEAAVVAMPSLWPEPFGLVGLEAMAHGRPVVAFDVGGISEWLTDAETGFLVPPGNVDAMADRLRRLLDDPVLARDLGMRGRARVEREFGVHRHLGQLMDAYAEVRARHRRACAQSGRQDQ